MRELTPREFQILSLLAAGYHRTEIARELFVSYGTAKKHCEQLLNKLGARTGAHAVAIAYRSGILAEAVSGG
jgi:DNA-binding NarL/FixJ family response regulator